MPRTDNHPTYRHILRLAWPVVVASASTPLLGLVDTAIIGHTRPAAALGAIAMGSLLLTCVFWLFGFLRMSTTGFVAQADGAENPAAVRAASFRALLLGAGLGVLLILLQGPLAFVLLPLLGAEGEVRELARSYFEIRVWAAPATLMSYALFGILIGLGKTKTLLLLQLMLNGLNIILDLLFAGGFGWGVPGIALGTLIAEWTATLAGFSLVWRILRKGHADTAPFIPWPLMAQAAALRATFIANGNIMVRTLAMLAGMAWFTRQGAQLGETVLAANHVLIGIVSFCAFFLDGIAFPTEALTGAATGRRDLLRFDRTVRRTSLLAGATALVLSLLILGGGTYLIRLITDLPEVIILARASLPFVALYVALSVAAFQLDGIFIGTTHTKEMRNASWVAVLIYGAASIPLATTLGQTGLWFAMLLWVSLRGLTQAYYYPAIRRTIRDQPTAD